MLTETYKRASDRLVATRDKLSADHTPPTNPLLLQVPEDFKNAAVRVLFFDQETNDCEWEAYQAVISTEQHQAVDKDSGLTAHVEHFNNSVRQRLARYVRKTLSFSKPDQMHLVYLHLFLHRYKLK